MNRLGANLMKGAAIFEPISAGQLVVVGHKFVTQSQVATGWFKKK